MYGVYFFSVCLATLPSFVYCKPLLTIVDLHPVWQDTTTTPKLSQSDMQHCREGDAEQ